MNATKRISAALLSLTLLSGIAVAQYGPPPPPQGDDWNNAPRQFVEAQQRGYRDGVQGARKDYDNHRRPDVNNRDEYRHPNFMRPPDREDYRKGFREGYRVAVQHIYGMR